MNVAERKFSEIKQLFKRLSDEIFNVTESYWTWRALTLSRSIPESGKELAEKNNKIRNQYLNFFSITEHNLMHSFIIGICKFFDRRPGALSIKKLIKEINSNKTSLSAKALFTDHPNRFDEQERRKHYLPIDEAAIKHIDGLILKHASLIKKLTIIRHTQSAHTSIEKMEGSFVPNEIEILIKDIQKIFNTLSDLFDRSSTVWDHIEGTATNEVNFLFENLRRGEEQRLLEIEKKY